jgi:DNA-binding transcriptional ArsR family regulator
MKKAAAGGRAARIAREEREDEEVRLARAVGHPRRVAILECLNANGPMTPTELAEWLDADLSNLSYHVRVLAKAGVAEEVGQEPGMRGRPKTVYRATARAMFSDSAWSSLSPTAKAGISATMFQVLTNRVSDALLSGTFDSKDSRHLSVSTIAVDEEGWNEVSSLLAAVFHRVAELEDESRERGGRLVPLSVGLLGFESPRMYE